MYCTHLVAEAVEFGHTPPGVHEDLGAERRAQRVHREDAVEHYTDLHATLRITDSFIVDRSDKSPLSLSLIYGHILWRVCPG